MTNFERLQAAENKGDYAYILVDLVNEQEVDGYIGVDEWLDKEYDEDEALGYLHEAGKKLMDKMLKAFYDSLKDSLKEDRDNGKV